MNQKKDKQASGTHSVGLVEFEKETLTVKATNQFKDCEIEDLGPISFESISIEDFYLPERNYQLGSISPQNGSPVINRVFIIRNREGYCTKFRLETHPEKNIPLARWVTYRPLIDPKVEFPIDRTQTTLNDFFKEKPTSSVFNSGNVKLTGAHRYFIYLSPKLTKWEMFKPEDLIVEWNYDGPGTLTLNTNSLSAFLEILTEEIDESFIETNLRLNIEDILVDPLR